MSIFFYKFFQHHQLLLADQVGFHFETRTNHLCSPVDNPENYRHKHQVNIKENLN